VQCYALTFFLVPSQGGATFYTGTIAVGANQTVGFANTQFVASGGTAATGILQKNAFLIVEGDPVSIDITEDIADASQEPGTWLLIGAGLIGLGGYKLRRR